MKDFSIKSKLFALSLISVCLCCCSCSRTREIYENGYFRYIFRGDNSTYQDSDDRSIVIVGFSEEGLKQESLDIPREIDGYPVKNIGLDDQGFTHNNNVEVEAGPNLKKLFIFDNIECIDFFYGPNVDIMLCADDDEFHVYFLCCKSMYYYSEILKNCDFPDDYYIKKANIVFKNNFNNESNEIYRVDNIKNDEKIVEPPMPTREGFNFTGWFTESECLNKWNFDSEPVFGSNKEFVLYAGWNN